MNRNLWLLTVCQGLFLTNNVTFIAINGLVGLSLAPQGWMATLPVMAYVLGGALAAAPVAWVQRRLGRLRSFQVGAAVAVGTSLLCAYAAVERQFGLLCLGTLLAGYYSANAALYRFVAAELAEPQHKERAVSWVLAGGLIGAVAGPELAQYSRSALGTGSTPFAAAYVVLAGVAALNALLVSGVRFPAPVAHSDAKAGRSVAALLREPLFLIALTLGSLSYGVMNLLMAATPLAMQTCGLPFGNAATVLQWHVVGMFAPGFVTGHLIKRFGATPVMAVGLALYALCIAVALSGVDLHQFVVALLALGVGWNLLYTGATTVALKAYEPHERHQAQGALNFCQFGVLAISSFSSGALVTTQGWAFLNWASVLPVAVMALALWWLYRLSVPR